MKKLIPILVFIIIALNSFGQTYPIVPRSNSSITVQDARTKPLYNMFLPVYSDTTQASLPINLGIDSCGALIFTYNYGLWYRACSPKRWIPVLPTSSATGDTAFWRTSGNRVAGYSGVPVIGTIDSVGFYIETDGQKRIGIAANGIQDSSALTIIYLGYNTATGLLSFAKTPTGGGGSPAGNFGNLQINRSGFDTPGGDSLNWAVGKLSVKGHYSATGNIYLPNSTSAVGSLYLNNLRWLGNWGDVSSHSNINAGIGAGSDTSLYGNVVLGWLAGQSNNGFDNILMGEGTARYMTGYDGSEGSSRNILIGDHAAGATDATGGKMNTGVGQEVFYHMTDSVIHCSAFSKSSSAQLRAGTGVVTMGPSILANGTGFRGSWVTVIGADALTSPTSGNNTTTGGAYSLFSSTTSSNNSAWGFHTLDATTSGSQNTAIGGYAGHNITTGNYNIHIGWIAGGADINASNEFVVNADASGGLIHMFHGNNATQHLGAFITQAQSIAQTTNFFWNGTSYLSGNTGIGVSNPTAGLHLSGTAKFDLGSDATGDIFYRNSSGFFTRLGIGTASQHLLGGTIPHWGDTAIASGGGTPGGSNTQVQFNNSSAFGGSANFTWNGSRMGAIAATIGSTSTPNGTSPLTIDAASTNTTYLLQMGKNGNPAYFRIDKDGNISDIGGGPARIQSTGGVPYFPDGFSSLYWPSASNANHILKGNVGSTYPWVFDGSASTTNGERILTLRATQAGTPGNILELTDAFFTGLSAFDGAGKLGLGNVAPTEKLDVTGNVKFSGALMPNNAAGTSGYLLQSAGAGSPPTWVNPTSITTATPTWQQTLTAGSTLTGSNTITGANTDFTWSNIKNYAIIGRGQKQFLSQSVTADTTHSVGSLEGNAFMYGSRSSNTVRSEIDVNPDSIALQMTSGDLRITKLNSSSTSAADSAVTYNPANHKVTMKTFTGVVSNSRLTAQTGAASLTTYNVPAADASYLVSANILVTTATLHNFTCTVTYTDEGNTSRTLTLNFSTIAGTLTTAIANATGTVPYEGVPLHIRCKASTTIVIATTGTFTTVTYNLENEITKLN